MRILKRVYRGLPQSLANVVLWVAREYRTNHLSHIEGGCDVVVEYHNNEVFGYDWIKKPSSYIKVIWLNNVTQVHDDFEKWAIRDQLEEIKNEIKSIYARKYKREDFDKIPFKKIWDSETSNNLPWEKLKLYDQNNYNKSYGYCKNCNKKLSGNKSKKLCYECWKLKSKPKLNYGTCNKCGKKLRGDKSKKLCYSCWKSNKKIYR